MPIAFVEKVAKQKGISVAEAEKKWEEAKSKAKDQGISEDDDKFFPIVMSIFKSMMGIKSKSEALMELVELIPKLKKKLLESFK